MRTLVSSDRFMSFFRAPFRRVRFPIGRCPIFHARSEKSTNRKKKATSLLSKNSIEFINIGNKYYKVV